MRLKIFWARQQLSFDADNKRIVSYDMYMRFVDAEDSIRRFCDDIEIGLTHIGNVLGWESHTVIFNAIIKCKCGNIIDSTNWRIYKNQYGSFYAVYGGGKMSILIAYNITYDIIGSHIYTKILSLNSYWEDGRDNIYTMDDLYRWYVRRSQPNVEILASPSHVVCSCGGKMALGEADLLIHFSGYYRLLRYYSNERGLSLIDFI